MSQLRKQKELRRQKRKDKRNKARADKVAAVSPFLAGQMQQSLILDSKGLIAPCSECGSTDINTQSDYCPGCKAYVFYNFCGSCGLVGYHDHGFDNVADSTNAWNELNGSPCRVTPEIIQ